MVPRVKSQLSVQDTLNFPRLFNNTAEEEVAAPSGPVFSWPIQSLHSLICLLSPQIFREMSKEQQCSRYLPSLTMSHPESLQSVVKMAKGILFLIRITNVPVALITHKIDAFLFVCKKRTFSKAEQRWLLIYPSICSPIPLQ